MYTSFPRSMSRNHESFAKGVEKTIGLGIEPGNVSSFANTVGVLSYMTLSTWERKMMLYKSLGLSHEEALTMFKNQPSCFALSDKRTKIKMDFFTQKLGISPSRLVSYPNIFLLSLEKRIFPRCCVLKLLITKGFIQTILLYHFRMTAQNFFHTFVEEYKDRVPEIVDAYNGKFEFEGLKLTNVLE
ncbi:hypothetical protein ZOSMA_33G00130 [Zostera marina]|uniref:Uncharacterized protein n=1 Tax=Zostera marina TaxID=29655 RepID=A0A0K9P9X6_ZOSMR|nr:hypothetical protein ZOSMA_33G00130 [Zostera marina]